MRRALSASAAALALLGGLPVFAADEVQLAAAETQVAAASPIRVEEVVVTARRREEDAQAVPIPLTVLSADSVADAGAFNANRLKELIPSVQFHSSNPRNSALNIRGIGAPFGLTNDGLEQGVGLYVDGVYNARPAAARFLLAPSANANTPGLLTGYGQRTTVASKFDTAAAFGQVEWKITDKLTVLPGLRINYDRKSVNYDNRIYGGLQTTNAALIALQRSILALQTYAADIADTNLSYQGTVSYAVSDDINTYATYAKSYKSVGLNTAGVPADTAGNPALSAASVRPESVNHFEVGIKTSPIVGVTANLAIFQTDVKDFQAQVQNAAVGVLRGYLANASKVRVRGVEFDSTAQLGEHFSLNGAVAYTEGEYVSFADAPPPIELTGGPSVVDISGSRLPGISKWSASLSGEYRTAAEVFGRAGDVFAALDFSVRSSFSSSPTASAYLNVAGYGLANARVGFRADDGWDAFLWVRNLTDQRYYEQLAPVSGGTGLIVGQPGDPRTFGITLRAQF